MNMVFKLNKYKLLKKTVYQLFNVCFMSSVGYVILF
jgi:hypothetical protein